MTLSPLHLEHLKRCLNRLSIAVLHADQPGVSRLAEQPPVMQQALRRLQQGLDATAGVVAVQQWSGQATPEPMPAPEEGVMGHPTLVPEPPIAPAAQAERSAASGSMQAETAASIADGAVDRDATSLRPLRPLRHQPPRQRIRRPLTRSFRWNPWTSPWPSWRWSRQRWPPTRRQALPPRNRMGRRGRWHRV